MDDNAQSPQPAGEVADAGNPNVEAPAAPSVPDSVQKRFDELTAKIHERDARLQEMYQQQQQLMFQLVERQQSQAPVEAAPEIDPEEARKWQYLMKQVVDPLKQEIAALRQSTHGNTVTTQMQELKAELQIHNDPQLTAAVQDRISAWQKQGILGKLVEPMDALRLIVGDRRIAEARKSSSNTSERQQFNNLGAPLGAQPRRTVQSKSRDTSKDPAVGSKGSADFYFNQMPDEPF